MSDKELFQKMIGIVEKAGKLADDLIENSNPEFKTDFSIVTKADKAISDLIRRELSELLKTSDHILLDEEDVKGDKYFDHNIISATPYIWVSDPIDGTRNFSNRMPLYGISLGLFKNCKPHMGAVYFPAMKELFYCDGHKAYFIQNAFSKAEKKTEIVAIDQKITRQSVFLMSDAFFKRFEWDYGLCQFVIPSCAVVDLCWPAIGRGCGCIFNSYLWDYAGSWAICQAAGLQMRSLETGRVMDRLELDLFIGKAAKTWRLKEYYLLSSPRNYEILKNNIQPRK